MISNASGTSIKHSRTAGLAVLPAVSAATLFLGFFLALGSSLGAKPVLAVDNPSQPAYFTEKVRPVLEANCYRCHGGINHRGGLNLATREDMLKGGHHGPAVVAGHPEQSWMVKLIRHEGPADDPMNMPPAPKPKLSDADIAVIETWIRAGAVMPPTAPAGAAAPAGR